MAFNPKITISSAPGISVNLYVALYEATSPNVEVTGQLIPPPHIASVQLQFTGLNDVIHLVKVFETAGTIGAGTVRANFSIDPQSGGVVFRQPDYLTADTSAGFVSGGANYTDSSYIDEDIELEIQGAGTQFPVSQYTFDNSTGTISIVDPAGYQIQPGEKWIVKFTPKTLATPPGSAGNIVVTSFQTISADIVLTNGDEGKGFLLKSATTTLSVTLPAISTLTANKPWYFVSLQGTHINAVLKTNAADFFLFATGLAAPVPTKIVLGQWESVVLIPFANTQWLVLPQGFSQKEVGEIFFSHDTLHKNVLLCNGQTVSRTQYVRLWDYVSNLDTSMRVSDANWLNVNLNNKGRFSTGNGTSTFRVPDLTDAEYITAVGGGTAPAGIKRLGAVGQFIFPGIILAKSGNNNRVVVIANINDANLGTRNVTFNANVKNTTDRIGLYALIRI